MPFHRFPTALQRALVPALLTGLLTLAGHAAAAPARPASPPTARASLPEGGAVSVTAPRPVPSAPAALPGTALPVPPAPALLLPAPLRLAHPLGDSYLLRPDCRAACPLVVVHHPHGRSADEMLERPHLRALYAELLAQGAAVLVSHDAGRTGWGSPTVLRYAAEVHAGAVKHFPWNGNTYALGLSMGGLPALLSAHTQPYRVQGVILIDAKVNLRESWEGTHDPRFEQHRREIEEAYRLPRGAVLPFGLDPLEYVHRAVPLLVISGDGDGIVDFWANGRTVFRRSQHPDSRLIELPGAHLSMSRFAPEVLAEVGAFLRGREARVLARR